ncbi:baseplate J/gp47 family protein [Sabulicella glaciei]|uniref:Baseplate J/gp47 family protein n=1 Tax=Sabulicella glaciei TaxID=2984948 RepID=A0ABT3NQ34_9PROT|nr:baseplate J/gp47 family protein [Roseococcus sp. MDT2-1-1]MCW8084268.1 baseplate J/gp47 family protein [Roseococcus sp. MDT2-1-1]
MGEHGSFLETMKARLSSSDFPALAGLGSRETDDPTIALLDAWSTVGDVLTFYQERLANEGYLRTATERRSVLELARLVGYQPRPGVAATTYLSFEIDANAADPVTIPVGTKVQSLPGPGEAPQTFETIEKRVARREWNAIRPRLERPPTEETILYGDDESPFARVYVKGISTGLKPNDALLLQVGDGAPRVLRALVVTPNIEADRTEVRLGRWRGGEVEAPSALLLRRALAQAQRAPAERYPGLAGEVIAEVDLFLAWLTQMATASPLHPELAILLRSRTAVGLILDTLVKTRQATASAPSESALLDLMDRTDGEGGRRGFVPDIERLSRDVIEEFTGIDDGGMVGAETDALAARLAALGPSGDLESGPQARASRLMRKVIGRLAAERSIPPRNSEALARDYRALFSTTSDVGAQAVGVLEPKLAGVVGDALANVRVADAPPIRLWVLKDRALLFGATAPLKVLGVDQKTGVVTTSEWTDADIIGTEDAWIIALDSPRENLVSGDWVVLDYGGVSGKLGRIGFPKLDDDQLLIALAGRVQSKGARAGYGMVGQTTRIPLLDPQSQDPVAWFRATDDRSDAVNAFQFVRNLAVLVSSTELELAPEPITAEICGDQWIETDALYSGLETGRWVVVSGERSDLLGTPGLKGSELAMIAAVRQDVARTPGSDDFAPGESLHSFIRLAAPLAYCYKRSSVALSANVAKATHGDGRSDVLGGGDATVALQSFMLRQPPLTYVPANTPQGVESTLRVFVDGVEWKEVPTTVGMGPSDRVFVTQVEEDGATRLVFGDGKQGARLPTGQENVLAFYRSGLGKAGNVALGQINQLVSRPLGVKGTSNPIEAAGGADREPRDRIRVNVPLGVQALDRLVGPKDYADFTRTFGGIGKAAADRVFVGGGAALFVTIAGADDIPVPKSSGLYANLVAALRTFGDPALPVQVESRELLMMVMSARVAPDPAYLWEDVIARVRAALVERYSFDRQELGQQVALSEVIGLIQAERGVLYVDVDALGAVSQLTPDGERRSPQELSAAMREVIDADLRNGRPAPYVRVRGARQVSGKVLPTQLAMLPPSLPETLILTRIEAP